MTVKKQVKVIGIASVVIVGAFIGYAVVYHSEVIGGVTEKLRAAYRSSRDRMDDVSEEVALKTAQLTRNPKVNQDWVSRQWESVGY